MKPHRGSEEITEFVDPDFKRLFPGTCAFTNKLGGRIVVFPLEIAGSAQDSKLRRAKNGCMIF